MASLMRMAATRRNPILNLPSALSVACRGIATKLWVGGLSFCTTEEGLSQAFSQYGQVIEAKIITDKVTEKSKGFGFVTFASHDEASSAITAMDRKLLNGRFIYVNYAKARVDYGGSPIARGPPEPINIEELKMVSTEDFIGVNEEAINLKEDNCTVELEEVKIETVELENVKDRMR